MNKEKKSEQRKLQETRQCVKYYFVHLQDNQTTEATSKPTEVKGKPRSSQKITKGAKGAKEAKAKEAKGNHKHNQQNQQNQQSQKNQQNQKEQKKGKKAKKSKKNHQKETTT